MKLIDYLSGKRRGREAHDLELEAQRDPLLAEALQGLEENPGDHHAAVESLRRRIAARAGAGKQRRRMRLIWRTTAVAAALLIAVTAGFMTLQRAGAPEGREIARGPEIPEFPTVPVPPSGEMAELPPEVPERPERPPIPQPSAVPSKVPPQDGIADPAEQPRGDEDTDPTHPVEGEEEQQPVIRAYGAVQKAEFTGSTSAQQKAETPSVAAHPSVTAQERPATEGDFPGFQDGSCPDGRGGEGGYPLPLCRDAAPLPGKRSPRLPNVGAETDPPSEARPDQWSSRAGRCLVRDRHDRKAHADSYTPKSRPFALRRGCPRAETVPPLGTGTAKRTKSPDQIHHAGRLPVTDQHDRREISSSGPLPRRKEPPHGKEPCLLPTKKSSSPSGEEGFIIFGRRPGYFRFGFSSPHLSMAGSTPISITSSRSFVRCS